MSQYKSLTAINKNRLFAGINPESLKINLKQGNFLEFQEGDIIYQKGDKDDSIYLIIDGEIKLKIRDPLSGVSVLRKGREDFFGENEFLNKNARYSSAVANTSTLLFKLNRTEIVAITSQYKNVLKNLNGDESILDSEEQSDNSEVESGQETDGISSEKDDITDGADEIDLSELNSGDEQINWDKDKLDNIDDIHEEPTQEQNDDILSSSDMLSYESIKWDNSEFDKIDNLNPDELKADPDLEDLNSAAEENIKWDEEGNNNFSDLSAGHSEEETGEAENTPDSYGDVKWDEQEFNSIPDLPEDSTGDINLPENISSNLDDVKWDENEFNKIGDSEKKQNDEPAESMNISEIDSENLNDINRNTEDISGISDAPEYEGSEPVENPEETGNVNENLDDVKWNEKEFDSFNDINSEHSDEQNLEAENPSGIYGNEEITGADEKPINNIDDLPDYRLNDLSSETEIPESEPESGEKIKWDDKQFENLDNLPEEPVTNQDEDIFSSDAKPVSEETSEFEETHKYDEPLSDTEESTNIQDENISNFDNHDITTLSDSENDLLNRQNEEDDIYKINNGEPNKDYDSMNEDQNEITGETYNETAGIPDERTSEDNEGKPVVGIYENSEYGEAKELTDEEIYERVLRDLIYLYKCKNLSDTVVTVKELVKNFTGATLVNLYMVDTPNNEMKLLEVEDDKIQYIKSNLSDGIISSAIINNEIISLKDPAGDFRYNHATDSFGGNEINSILCFPVNNNINEVAALFSLANCLYESFSEKDEKYLRILSDHALNHISNIEQFEKIPANLQTKSTEIFSNFVIEDIKSPLLIIKHYADFIKRKALPEEIRLVSNYMLNQVDSVLSFSSVISDLINGNLSLNPERQKLDELLDEILEMLAEYVDTRKVKLFKRYDSTAEINADKSKLYHAMYQLTKILCSNMPDGGSIYLVTLLKNGNVEISFKDTGSGLPEGTEEILTKQFSELSNIDELSLELAIAKKITEDHGGTIKLKKNSENGTEFVMIFPAAD